MANTDFSNLITKLNSSKHSLKDKFGLDYNPFPKSGIAVIDESDEVIESLSPVDEITATTIIQYIRDALEQNSRPSERNNLSLLIRGDYGTGKTHMLMFLKHLLRKIKTEKFRPYVVYVDNPGQKFSEVVGNIVSQVGIENFRRYLWNEFWEYLDNNTTKKEKLKEEVLNAIKETINVPTLFGHEVNDDRVNLINSYTSSYKYMLDNITKDLKATTQKQIISIFKNYMLECFCSKYEASAAAEYFYDVVTENIDVSKSWGQLIQGKIKDIDKREVNILNAVVNIVTQNEKCTHFIMLIDEFEEITVDRLKTIDKDTYIRNLRAFIDKDKHWSCVFAMTGLAFEKIESFSPPLADRIHDRIIELRPLDFETAKIIISNYLSIAREDRDKSISPFTDSSIKALLNVKDVSMKGLPRFVLKSCYLLLQRAVDSLNEGELIDDTFVKKYMGEYIK